MPGAENGDQRGESLQLPLQPGERLVGDVSIIVGLFDFTSDSADTVNISLASRWDWQPSPIL